VPVERLTPEKRRELTRAHLLAAAAEVFAERGFHGATLDQIADAAGFSKGAVYSNFASKEELFIALIDEHGRALIKEFGDAASAGEQDPASLIERLSDVYKRRNAKPETWALWTEFTLFAIRNPHLRKRLVEGSRATQAMVIDLVEQHASQSGVNPPLPHLHIALIYSAIFQGLWQPSAVDPEGVPGEMFAEAIVFIRQAIEALGKPRKAGRRPPGR